MTPAQIEAHVLGMQLQITDLPPADPPDCPPLERRPEHLPLGRMVMVTLRFPHGLMFSGESHSEEGDTSIDDEIAEARAQALAKAADYVARAGVVFPDPAPAEGAA